MIIGYDPTVDFSRIRFLGRARLGLSSDKEVMRLTCREFMGRYKAYKDTFDVENMLRVAGTTYRAQEAKSRAWEQDWV